MSSPPLPIELRKREHEAVNLFSLGHTTKSAARIMRLAPKTVEVLITNARERNDCSTIPQLVGQYVVSEICGLLTVID